MTKLLHLAFVTLALNITVFHNEISAQSHANRKFTSDRENLTENKKERNKKIALSCIHAWNDNNLDEIVMHLAHNTVDYGDGSTPPARGIDTVRMFMDLWRSSLNEYKSENELAVADSDYVFIYADWSGSFKSDFMGMKTAGKSFRFKDVDIFRFNYQGEIIEHRAVLFSRVLNELAGSPKMFND